MMTNNIGTDGAAATAEPDPATALQEQIAARRARLAARRAALPAAGQALLDQRLQRADAPATSLAAPSIPPRSAGAPIPLSFQQQRVWMLEQRWPGTKLYHVTRAETIGGPINRAAFEQSLQTIVRRHQILRTSIAVRDGTPVQEIAPAAHLPLPFIDLRAYPFSEREAAAQRFIAGIQKPFDLSEAPLLRVGLVRLDEEMHVLLLMMHQLVSDAWSVRLLAQEFTALYTALAAGQPARLPPLPLHYADFACWQRDWLRGERLQQHLDYWVRQLAGAPALLSLPTDRPRPASPSRRGGQASVVVPQPLYQALEVFSQQNNVTLFMSVLAGFQLLLARLGGQYDIVVGTPVAGRTRPELEGLIGCFANLLALRTDLSGNPSFRALVQRVRGVCLDADAHQELPFCTLVEALRPGMPLEDMALFQALFDLQIASSPPARPAHMASNPVRQAADGATFDLILALQATPQELAGTLTFSTDLFDASSADRICRQFITLLERLVASVDQPVMELPLA
jgi:hypothetical protein